MPPPVVTAGGMLFGMPPPVVTAAGASSSAGPKVTGPFVGHGVEHHHRGLEFQTLSPVKGTNYNFPPYTHPNPQSLPHPTFALRKSYSSSMLDTGQPAAALGLGSLQEAPEQPWENHHSSDKLPKLNFPKFDGENPRLWIRNCNDYFEMYDVAPRRWIKVSTMHLTGAAARWFPAVEQQVVQMSWPQFTAIVLERFGKDQHELLIRQLFHIKQTGQVQEYADKFTSIVDGLIAYGKNTDPIYYAMKFVDGLRDDIRTVVHMQRPSTLDTAVVLALLQEEMLDTSRKKELRRPDQMQWGRLPPRAPPPLPTPPVRGERPDRPAAAAGGAEDRRGRGVDAKLNTLRDYRRACGLCIRCGEKWSSDHRCPEQIQLHVLQEVWDICHCDETAEPEDDTDIAHDGQLFLTLSAAAVSTQAPSATMQFRGQIQGRSVSILVDSGSSTTFVSAELASQLQGGSTCHQPIRVTVANGAQLMCHTEFQNLQWSIQSVNFVSLAKVLPLPQYDLIVGMDWLAQHSPMQIDWRYKQMLITYRGSKIFLQGQLDSLPDGSVLQVAAVTSEEDSVSSPSVPAEIVDLLSEYQDVFVPPVGYPPARHCDHEIPLISGASPVQIRPYRYPPAVKDEIERQVSEMLQSGLIQPSKSPFSSVVLLVKKKDGSFRFCVDFRQLNAITAKNKYPVPVIEELLDELQGASWFSSLDLAAGYHQIRLREGEEPKTAFQTHSGQYEFRVMAFALRVVRRTCHLSVSHEYNITPATTEVCYRFL